MGCCDCVGVCPGACPEGCAEHGQVTGLQAIVRRGREPARVGGQPAADMRGQLVGDQRRWSGGE